MRQTLTYPADERITSGIKAAISRTYEAWDYHQARAHINRHLGNLDRSQRMQTRADAYAVSLGRLEDLAHRLGIE